MKKFYPHLLASLLLISMLPQVYGANKNNLLSGYFIENKGQVQTERGAPAEEVLFYTAGGQMQMFLTKTGYALVTRQTTSKGTTYNKIDFQFENVQLRREQVVFVNGKRPNINYYSGNKRIEDVIATQNVIVRNLYPGIDWMWTIDADGKMKHEFMVNIGANASLIKYKVDGANSAVVGANKMVYTHPAFTVAEGPILYDYKGKTIRGAMKMDGPNISYGLSPELKNGGFTIDPPIDLQNLTFADSGLHTGFRSIDADRNRNTISVGYSSDYSLPVFPQVNGSYNAYPPIKTDAVIMKTDSIQNLIWATFFGGAGNDEANAVTTYKDGIFITGFSESWNFPQATAGNYNEPVALTGRDAFIAKFSFQGKWQYSTGYGGGAEDEGNDIACFGDRIYVVGHTKSNNFPVLQRGGSYFYQNATLNNTDAFILEFDTACNRKWATTFGGSGHDYLTSVFADATGVYTTGYSDTTSGTTIPLLSFGSAYFQNTSAKREAFVTSFTLGGGLQWSTFLGGTGNDAATCIARTSCGIYICGRTDGAGLPVQDQANGNYYHGTYGGGGSDGFIVRFDPNNFQKKYCTYYGSTGYDILTKFDFNNSCQTIFTGYTNGTLGAVPGPFFFFHRDTLSNFSTDGIMLGLDNQQKQIWSTYFGSEDNDYGNDVEFSNTFIVDMVGEGFFNYAKPRIGGTYRADGCASIFCPQVTCNGVSNRFLNSDTISSIPGYSIPGGGGGGGGNPLCRVPLLFQALIPIRNTCPSQCNGEAYIDDANMGGCPPFTYLWNNGNQGLSDNQLCEFYWSKVTDQNNASRVIYGRFDVLRVDAMLPTSTNCSLVPNWDSLIKPKGGGPPYEVRFRGTRGSCPTTAFFDIRDTANCIVSFSTEWYEYNTNLYPELLLVNDNGVCKLNAKINPANDLCNDFDPERISRWKYVIYSSHDTFTIPFVLDKTVYITTPTGPEYYSGYLDLGDCRQPFAGLYASNNVKYTIDKQLNCQNGVGSITVWALPDTLRVNSVGSYKIKFRLQGTNLTGYNRTDSVTINSLNPASYTFTNLGADDYTITIYTNLCDEKVDSIPLRIINFEFNDPNVFCGKVDSLQAIVKGGSPPYTFNWSANSTNNPFIIINTGGPYSVTISDTAGCIVSKGITIGSSPSVYIDSLRENLSPCSATLFSEAQVYASQGSPPLTYLWSSGENGSFAQFIPADEQWIRVTDRYGCKDTLYFMNTKAPKVQAEDSITDISCYGYKNGIINVNISLGYAPYTVKWSDTTIISDIRTGLQVGNYRFTVTDNKGCTANGFGSIEEPDSLRYFVTKGPANCSASDGYAVISVTGGYSPFSIYWGSNINDNSFSKQNIPAGDYDFTVVDGRDCQKQGTVNIIQQTQMFLTATYKDVSCNNYNDGQASVTVFNGASPVRYKWNTAFVNPGDTTPAIQNLEGGYYSVTVTDFKGCIKDTVLYVNNPEPLTAYVDSGAGIRCHGEDVLVSISGLGGTPPYLSGDTMGYYFPGTYDIALVDTNGCMFNSSFTLEDPPVFSSEVLVTEQPTCSDSTGSISVNTIGGQASYFVYIDNQFRGTYNDSLNLDKIRPGRHQVVSTDTRGCEVDTIISIDSYVAINGLLIPHHPGCTGSVTGGATLIMQGIAPFTLEGDAREFLDTIEVEGLGPGNYTFVVHDARGCADTLKVKLVPTVQLIGSYNIIKPVACYGDSATVVITATGGTPPIAGVDTLFLPGGNFEQFLSDTNGCSTTLSGFVSSPTDSLQVSAKLAYTTCNQQTTVTVYATGGETSFDYTFVNSPVNLSFSDSFTRKVDAGVYSYEIQDERGCTRFADFTATEPDSFKGATQVQNPACFGTKGSVTINMQGVEPFHVLGQSFENTYTINNLAAGEYTYIVTDGRGCNDTLEATLANPAKLEGNYNFVQRIVCFGDSATVNITGSGGIGTITGTGTFKYPGGTFLQTLTDSNGCTADVNVVVPAPVDSMHITARVRQATCRENAFVTIAVTGGGSGQYRMYVNNGVFPFEDSLSVFVTTGRKVIQIRDSFGCIRDIPLDIVITDTIQGKLEAHDRNCKNDNTGAITITMQKGLAPYNIDGQSFNDTLKFNNVDPGPYVYRVQDSRGCELLLTGAVFEPEQLIIDTNLIQNPITCYGLIDATINARVNGGTPVYRYSLFSDTVPIVQNSDNGLFTGLAPGVYSVQVTDTMGCKATAPATILPFAAHNNSVATTGTHCYDGSDASISIYSQPADKSPYTYSLNGEARQFYNVYYNLPAGDYTIVVADKYNCLDTLQVTLNQPDSIDGRIWLNGSLLPNGTTTIRERQEGVFTKQNNLKWTVDFNPPTDPVSTSDTTIVVRPHQDVTYTITVYQDNTDSACYKQYRGAISVTNVASIPNIVTPNGDGLNDRWEIDMDEFGGAEVTIIDRWGELVFQSDNYQNDWDGTFKNTGRHVPDGTYFYIMRWPSRTTGEVVKGDINVLNSKN